MAKPSKIEDYWRSNNIENLLKEITHTLAQRMPTDPAVAIVQHLQKKFPKSFKTSTDPNNTSINTMSKTLAGTLQLRPTFSPRSDSNNESNISLNMERRLSNQSQGSASVTIPTVGSAFTDLLKQDTSNVAAEPVLNLKNLVFANRLSQQAVKLGKDIRSDRDILEEELVKPSKKKANVMSTPSYSTDAAPDDPHYTESHAQPSTKQLIEYKQKIRLENDRRSHRQQLADLAKNEREKVRMLQPDLDKVVEIQQQPQNLDDDDDRKLSRIAPETTATKGMHKSVVKSKEEEEILNDENIFQRQRQRPRDRQRNRTSRSNSPYARREYVRNLSSTSGKGFDTSTPITLFGICKVCGNTITAEGDQSQRDVQQISAPALERRFSPDRESTSSANVDDWFESPSNVSTSHELVPWKPDEVTPRPLSANPFQEVFFQPITENNSNQRRSPSRPAILADDEAISRRSSTAASLSESNTFIRTPEPLVRRPSSSLSIAARRSLKPFTYAGATLTIPTAQRRNSDVSVREQSPMNTDEN